MAKYLSQEELGKNISFDFDRSEFGDIEIFGTLMDYKKKRKSFWDNIEVGGSIAGPILVYKEMVFCGACGKNFYCLDMQGKELWRFKTNGMLNFLTLHNNVIYFGSWDCHLYAVDTEGKLLWKFATSISSPSKIMPPQ